MLSVGRRNWSVLGFICCYLGCIGDLSVTFILPAYDPGYNPLSEAISALGIASSPVGSLISFLWIIFGIIIMVFAVSYYKTNVESTKRIAAWLIGIYALCDVTGSGAFPGTFTHGKMTVTQNLHDILGSIGTVAIVLTPVVFMRDKDFRSFLRYLQLITAAGITLWTLFIIGRYINPEHWISKLHGLWQRLSLFNYYAFLFAISYKNLRKTGIIPQQPQPGH